MTRYIKIQKGEHQNAGYQLSRTMEFAAGDISVPIVFDELGHIVASMTIGFQKNDLADTIELVALQSLKPDSNAYVMPNGRWLAGYVPSYYRAFPFALLPGEGLGELFLSVDRSVFKETCEEGDVAFFEEDQLNPKLEQISAFLVECLKGRQRTLKLCKQLQSHGLIVEWPIPLAGLGENEKEVLSGFYRIDSDKLKQLSESVLLELNQSGALKLAYAQELSASRIDRLFSMYQMKQKMLDSQSGAEPDLEQLFDNDDEMLSF